MMLSVVLALIGEADATEIGVERRWGVGIELGAPNAVTGKYFFDDLSGVSLHAGWWADRALHVRAQYEREFLEVANPAWARLGLYWLAGVHTGFLPFHPYYDAAYVGPHAGAAAELQFHDIPINVFLEADVGAAAAFATPETLIWPIANIQLGGRYHF